MVHLPLVVGADDNGKLTWNINASFSVHPDCKSHTGACLTLGHGSILSISAKQKINTKSSTEAEFIGVDDAMTFVIWMKHFFESQVRSVNMDPPLKLHCKTLLGLNRINKHMFYKKYKNDKIPSK